MGEGSCNYNRTPNTLIRLSAAVCKQVNLIRVQTMLTAILWSLMRYSQEHVLLRDVVLCDVDV